MRLLKSTILLILINLSALSCSKNNCVNNPAVLSGNCIDSTLIVPDGMCFALWEPVCGCNNVTYSNSCNAIISGVTCYEDGECCD